MWIKPTLRLVVGGERIDCLAATPAGVTSNVAARLFGSPKQIHCTSSKLATPSCSEAPK
jgi:hypothetical protein